MKQISMKQFHSVLEYYSQPSAIDGKGNIVHEGDILTSDAYKGVNSWKITKIDYRGRITYESANTGAIHMSWKLRLLYKE